MDAQGIHGIDWAALTCCCGDARHVPGALRELCSNDLDVVERAYWQLENHVVAQSTLFTSAEPIPRIILELWPRAQHKGTLMNLLFLIGSAGDRNLDAVHVRCRDGALSAYRALIEREAIDSVWRKSLEEDLRDLEQPISG
jgi:hypothetical protein